MCQQMHRIGQLRDGTEQAQQLLVVVCERCWQRRKAGTRFYRQENARNVAALSAHGCSRSLGPQPARSPVIGDAVDELYDAVAIDILG